MEAVAETNLYPGTGNDGNDNESNSTMNPSLNKISEEIKMDTNKEDTVQEKVLNEKNTCPKVKDDDPLKLNESNEEVSENKDYIFEGEACEDNEDHKIGSKDKSRFNLRKRNQIHSNAEDYGSDDFDFDGGYYNKSKKWKYRSRPSVSKKNYRRNRLYTNETVKLAVKMIQSEQMNLQEASLKFKIPRTSLNNFVQLYKRTKRTNLKTYAELLDKNEEEEIVALILKLIRCGKRYSNNELRFIVQYYLVSNNRPLFKSGYLPTMGWIANLVDRQQALKKAKSKKNTKVAVEDVEEWQSQMEDYLVNDWDLDLSEMFSEKNLSRIFCVSAFRILLNSPSETSENKPSPVKKEPGTEDKSDVEVGVVLGYSADGHYMDPMIIFPNDRIDECDPNDHEEVRIMFNANGRVDEEAALRIIKEFDEYLVDAEIEKPVVFFCNDKHDLAHFSVIQYCWENQIVIACLPPKTTKAVTPFDVGVWTKVRSTYTNLWKNAAKNREHKINCGQFPDLFLKSWESAKNPSQTVRTFKKSGLIPFNVPSVLKESTDQVLNEAKTSQQIQIVIDKQKQIQHEIDQKKSSGSSCKVELQPTEGKSICRTVSNHSINEGMKSDFDSSESEEETIVKKSTIPAEASMEERSRGKLEGIEMCLRAVENFIPPDVVPVWNKRGADYRGRCELAFKLWRSVSLLLKAGCAMASIEQMSTGFLSPFGTDFSSTASFFEKQSSPVSQKPPVKNPTKVVSSSSKPVPKPIVKAVKSFKTKSIPTKTPMPLSTTVPSKKRKLKINKSIYSRPNKVHSVSSPSSNSPTEPFVKVFPSHYFTQEELDEDVV